MNYTKKKQKKKKYYSAFSIKTNKIQPDNERYLSGNRFIDNTKSLNQSFRLSIAAMMENR